MLTAVIQGGMLILEPVANALARVQTQVRERMGQRALVGVPKVNPALAIQAACVVDASAILALLRGEPGHELLAEAVAAGRTIHISAVSLAALEEALLATDFGDGEIEEILAPLGLDIHSYSVVETMMARAFAGHDLDVGTRAALALAAAKQVPLVSAQLDGDVGGVVVRVLGEMRGLPTDELVAPEKAEAMAEPAEKPVAHELEGEGLDFERELERAAAELDGSKA